MIAPFVQPVAFAADGPASENTSSDRALPYNVDPSCQTPTTEYIYEAKNYQPIPDAINIDGIANGYVRGGVGVSAR